MQDSKMQDQTKYEKKLTNKLDKFIFKSHTQWTDLNELQHFSMQWGGPAPSWNSKYPLGAH